MSIARQFLQIVLLGAFLMVLPQVATAEGSLAVGDSLPFFTLKNSPFQKPKLSCNPKA